MGTLWVYYLFFIAHNTFKNDMFYLIVSWYTAASHGGLVLTRPAWSDWVQRGCFEVKCGKKEPMWIVGARGPVSAR